MNIRHFLVIVTSLILTIAVIMGVANSVIAEPSQETTTHLENVRDYVAQHSDGSTNYAIDGGDLYAGTSLNWTQVATPKGVIVNAVAVDRQDSNIIYIGAANEMALYRSADQGQNWQQILLDPKLVGSVTDIAVDSFQRIIYVGTDTAGLFRLRDVGSSMTLSGRLLLDEPVLEVVADNTGVGMAFVRTADHLYRAEDYGLTWVELLNLPSPATDMVIADTNPAATIYVGTAQHGVVKSQDGLIWTAANDGLTMVDGEQLHIDSLAVDPMQPDVLYVATSSPMQYGQETQLVANVSMSSDGAQTWTGLEQTLPRTVVELLPVSGQSASVYALTTESRSPFALGSAKATATEVIVESPNEDSAWSLSSLLTWIIAGLAALALALAVMIDLRNLKPLRSGTATSAG